MLSLFPTMFLSLLAHAILRVCVGSTLLYLGYRHAFKDRVSLRITLTEHWPRFAGFFIWYLAFVEVVIGTMFIVGAWTQAAAIVGIVLSLKMLILRKRLAHPSVPQPLYYVMLLAASLSLLITGAGALAFDLPI